MIFQHTLSKVRDGSKTQTSRIRKPGDAGYLLIEPKFVIRNGWIIYRQHSTIAAQPGRGMKATDHIKILDIWDYDVRDITPEQVKAEGFGSVTEFWLVWCAMHDKQLGLRWHYMTKRYEFKTDRRGWVDYRIPEQVPSLLDTRPKEHYDSWGISFELV